MYVVEQKHKGRIYLYEVTSYWDKIKKQARQRRKYLGPKERVYKKSKQSSCNEKEKPHHPQTITHESNSIEPTSSFSSKTYGDIFIAKHIANELGIEDILRRTFNNDYK